MLAGFQWDPRKAEESLRKHGVSFYEAATAFLDALSVTRMDEHHTGGEARFILVGMSVHGRLLVVVHAERGEDIRIISARRATPSERRDYERGS